jgi:tetratricopeptide (TPR) repeat protein
MLAIAAKHQRAGRLPDAERIYRRILSLNSKHAGSLHMLGTLAKEVGRLDVAAQLILAAIAADPLPAAYHCNLGAVLQAQGKLDDAATAYELALDRNPNLAEAHMNLGTVLQSQGRLDQAAERFLTALALRQDLAEAHMNLGNIFQSQGKLADALERHDRALAVNPNLAEACFNRGNVLQALGKFEDAVTSYRQALSLRPGMPEAHGNMGNALRAQDRIESAVDCYERALALNPQYAEAHYNLGNLRQAQHLLDDAAACYRRALALNPDLPEAHYNLGVTRQAQDDLVAAAFCFDRAIELRPAYAEAHYNRACVLQQQGRIDEAMPSFQRAVSLKPDYSQARFGLALAQIQAGDSLNGWRNYEARWQSIDHETPMRHYSAPQWTGDLVQDGLLLWGEQGIGDEIQFAGLLPDAIRTGNRITLECDPRLEPLLARSFPSIQVVARPSVPQLGSKAEHDSSQQDFGAHLPTGSLPALFRQREATFAGKTSPYLKADAAATESFRTRYFDGRLLVGLAWQTNNRNTGRNRSIPLQTLTPLFELPGIRWISLQYGDFDQLEEQAMAASAPLHIDRSVDQFSDVDRFAAQVSAMDRVVTIDNSTAHLAGALGLQVSLMLPFAADWRWLKDRADTPWYHATRLFRQSQRCDWTPVIQSVYDALQRRSH